MKQSEEGEIWEWRGFGFLLLDFFFLFIVLLLVSSLGFFLDGADESSHTERFIPQAHSQGKGHLTKFGNKWGWIETNEAFVPQLVMYASPDRFYNNPSKIDADIKTFIEDHGFNGFHVPVFCRWFKLTESNCSNIYGSNPSPDMRTIEALKMLIQKYEHLTKKNDQLKQNRLALIREKEKLLSTQKSIIGLIENMIARLKSIEGRV